MQGYKQFTDNVVTQFRWSKPSFHHYQKRPATW